MSCFQMGNYRALYDHLIMKLLGPASYRSAIANCYRNISHDLLKSRVTRFQKILPTGKFHLFGDYSINVIIAVLNNLKQETEKKNSSICKIPHFSSNNTADRKDECYMLSIKQAKADYLEPCMRNSLSQGGYLSEKHLNNFMDSPGVYATTGLGPARN